MVASPSLKCARRVLRVTGTTYRSREIVAKGRDVSSHREVESLKVATLALGVEGVEWP